MSSAKQPATETIKQQRAEGERLRIEADRLSRRRIKWAPALGAAIAFSPNNAVVDTALSVVVGYIHDTDRRDGKKGKTSAKLLGEEPPAESKALDHKADKRFFYWTVGGLSVRAARRGRWSEAALYAGVGLGCAIRDKANIKMRDEATADGIDTGSRQTGRVKTALFAAVSTAATSPLNRLEGGVSRSLKGGMAVVGVLSLASHLDMKRHIDQSRAAMEEANTASSTAAVLEFPSPPGEFPAEESQVLPPAASPHSLS